MLMKKFIIVVLLTCMIEQIYGEENRMKISLLSDDDDQIVLHDGMPRTVIEDGLRKARRIMNWGSMI